VIVVEDILDTGLTLTVLKKLLLAHEPKALKIAALLDKPSRRKLPLQGDYVGFTIPDEFVVATASTTPNGIAIWPISALCRASKASTEYRVPSKPPGSRRQHRRLLPELGTRHSVPKHDCYHRKKHGGLF